MGKYLRRALIGAIAGLAAAFPLALTRENVLTGILLAVLVGVVYSIAFRPTAHAYADSAMTAAALGVPAWVIFGVILFPLFAGEIPEWSNQGMRDLFPELTNQTQDITQKSGEIRLNSTGDSPLQWLAGFFYRDRDSNFQSVSPVVDPETGLPFPTTSPPPNSATKCRQCNEYCHYRSG